MICAASRLQRFSTLQEDGIGRRNRQQDGAVKVFPVPIESREISLKLGGNTDAKFALSIFMLRAFLIAAERKLMQAEEVKR